MPSTTTRARAPRDRRLLQLGAVVAAALATVGALVAISQAGHHTTSPPGQLAQDQSVNARFAGLPQRGIALGRPGAPVTLVEFADLQCPFCRQWAQNVLPTLVSRDVRAGRLRIEFRNLAFIGPDSRTAALAAAGAASQNRLWPFVDLFYANQGEENTGYVTPAFLRRVAAGVRGLNPGSTLAYGSTGAAVSQLDAAQAMADRYGFSSTPSFLIGRTGGTLRPLTVTQLEPGAFTGPIDRLAA